MDYTVYGILQVRILEWVAFAFSRGSSNLETEPRSPALQADSLPVEPPGKPVALYSEWEMHRKTNILGRDAGNNIYKNVDFFFF